MKKKCISIITCIIMLIGCVNFSVCAADNPSYLYDESENFDVMPAGNNIPGNIEILHLPGNSDYFTYSFAGKTVQYSDFLIVPQTTTTGIRISYTTSSGTHSLTMKIIRKDTGETIYSEPITVLNGFVQEFYLPFTYLEKSKAYYIELSNPTTNNAAGTFTVTE